MLGCDAVFTARRRGRRRPRRQIGHLWLFAPTIATACGWRRLHKRRSGHAYASRAERETTSELETTGTERRTLSRLLWRGAGETRYPSIVKSQRHWPHIPTSAGQGEGRPFGPKRASPTAVSPQAHGASDGPRLAGLAACEHCRVLAGYRAARNEHCRRRHKLGWKSRSSRQDLVKRARPAAVNPARSARTRRCPPKPTKSPANFARNQPELADPPSTPPMTLIVTKARRRTRRRRGKEVETRTRATTRRGGGKRRGWGEWEEADNDAGLPAPPLSASLHELCAVSSAARCGRSRVGARPARGVQGPLCGSTSRGHRRCGGGGAAEHTPRASYNSGAARALQITGAEAPTRAARVQRRARARAPSLERRAWAEPR